MCNLSSVVKAGRSSVALTVCLAAALSSADIVFDGGFNGPYSGTGGAYDRISNGGTCSLASDVAGKVALRITKDDPMSGGGGYFSCAVTPSGSGTYNTMTMTPLAASNSLNAMTSVSGITGDRLLNGGFDFFFRSSTSISNAELRALDSDNRGAGGLRFTFGSMKSGTTRSLRLEMLSNANGLLSGSDTGTVASVLVCMGGYAMESNTVYHLGVTFATDDQGTVTAKIWGQEGAGAIDLATAVPVATLAFGIDENIVSNGFATGSFPFNQLRYENLPGPQTQEFDQLRIYNATPATFGALEDYAWRDSKAETVLRADFRGEGGGTGGTNDIVSCGGTGTLVDYGTVSDATVLNEHPFRDRSSGYLSIWTTNNAVSAIHGHARFVPAAETNSLAAMSVVTNGQRILRGGLDFFFRCDHSITNSNEFRPIDNSNTSAGGLRLTLHSQTATTMQLEIIANAGGLYSGGEGGTAVGSLPNDFAAALVSNTVYHVGVSFDGDASGNVEATVWLKQGTGEIDLRQEVPVALTKFGINESVVTNGLTPGVFDFGKLRNNGDVPSRQDFDSFRVYNDTPSVFTALPVPPGTMILMR